MKNKTMATNIRIILFLLGLLVQGTSVLAQVPVSLAPTAHAQFLSNAGIPLASGCVFTYQAGTSTPQATYTDSTGTSTNTNPVILNAGGFADIWLTNQNYKITVKSAGGVNCASGAQLWSVDNVSGFLGLLSLSNIWTNPQTFTQPITISPTINQIVLGAAPNQTTLNFPAPAGNVSLTFPNTADTMVGRATTDTLTNKTLTSPALNTTMAAAAGATICWGTNCLTSNANGILSWNGITMPQTVAQANVTGKTTTVSSTLLYAVPSSGAGLYRMNADVQMTTVATGGTIRPALSWTNDIAGQSWQGATVDATQAGFESGSGIGTIPAQTTFYAAASTNINYSTVFSGITGSPVYALRIRLEYLGP